MVKYVWMALKIGVHSHFGPNLPVEFVAICQRIVIIFQVCHAYLLLWPYFTIGCTISKSYVTTRPHKA